MPRKKQQSQNVSQCSQSNQQTLEEAFEINLNLDDQVNDLVRYIVNRAGEHTTFKRSDFKKHILSKAGQNYELIINKASDILKMVYGYNIIVVDSTTNSSKTYIVSNRLSYVQDPIEASAEQKSSDEHKVLLLLILSHIFMSNNSVSEASLFSFLENLKISVDVRHEIFGNVKDYIVNTLKNKKYIEIECDQMSKKTHYSWGPRAEAEISKHEILKFVCKMYKDRQPASWVNQFKSANEQHFENYKEGGTVEIEP